MRPRRRRARGESAQNTGWPKHAWGLRRAIAEHRRTYRGRSDFLALVELGRPGGVAAPAAGRNPREAGATTPPADSAILGKKRVTPPRTGNRKDCLNHRASPVAREVDAAGTDAAP